VFQRQVQGEGQITGDVTMRRKKRSRNEKPRSALEKIALLGLAVLTFTTPAFAKCDGSDPRLAQQFKAINAKYDSLHKTMMAAKWIGKEAKRGKCAITLLRIGAAAPFGLPPDESVKEEQEAISCLELEKWQLQQECKCHDSGLGFSRDDEPAETATLQAYKDIQDLRAKATKIGIRDKAIRSFVDRADEIKTCFDMNTVSLLRNIERDINNVFEAQQKLDSKPQ
jgi:hypothetical protein